MMLPWTLRFPLLRVARSPRAISLIALWVAVGILSAVFERQRGSAHGSDRVLLDSWGAIVLPLLAYAVVVAVMARRGLTQAVRPLARLGARPRVVALATSLATSCVSGALGAVIGAVLPVIAHGPLDPPVTGDALTSAWVGALGGFTYGAFFTFGSAILESGAGRALFLVFDWIVGSSGSALGLAVPRAHVHNLLGGEAPLDLPQATSAWLLVGLATLFTLGSTARSER